MLRSIWILKVRTGTPTRRPIHCRTDLPRLLVLTYTHILMPSLRLLVRSALPDINIEDIKGFNRTVYFSLRHIAKQISWDSKDADTVEIKFCHWESGRARSWVYWRLMFIEHGDTYVLADSWAVIEQCYLYVFIHTAAISYTLYP